MPAPKQNLSAFQIWRKCNLPSGDCTAQSKLRVHLCTCSAGFSSSVGSTTADSACFISLFAIFSFGTLMPQISDHLVNTSLAFMV